MTSMTNRQIQHRILLHTLKAYNSSKIDHIINIAYIEAFISKTKTPPNITIRTSGDENLKKSIYLKVLNYRKKINQSLRLAIFSILKGHLTKKLYL